MINKKSKKQLLIEHEKFLQKISPNRKKNTKRGIYPFPDLSIQKPNLTNTSNVIPSGGGYKRTLDDYKWRKGQIETKETIKAIEQKKKQVQPLYNKGSLQYITPDVDLTKMGKKI